MKISIVVGIGVLVILSVSYVYTHYLKSVITYEGNLEKVSAPLVMFDFDGVICDSFSTAIELINVHANEFKYEPLDYENREKYRNQSSKKLLTDLGL